MWSTLANWLGLGGPLSPKRIEKSGKLAANAFAQPDVRMREMQRLLKDGSEMALSALLQRFGVNAQGHIADEEEKRWLCDALVELGRPAVAPCLAYLRRENRLSHALETLVRIEGAERAAAAFVEVLREIGPSDHRRQEAKRELVLALGDFVRLDPVRAVLCEHLRDHSDDVRVHALDQLDRALTPEVGLPAAARAQLDAPLSALAQDPGVSQRVSQRARDLRKKHGFAAGS
jgi:hypothetical protein